MPGSANKVKLGELLVDAGIITSGDLTEAIQVSRRLGVPIGQVLLVSRCVTDNVLEAALEAQPLVKDGTLSRSSAIEALKKSHERDVPLRNVLDLNIIQEDNQQTSKRLAELLLDSDIVNQEQLDHALNTSFSSGMPLGSALVLEGVLSPSLFPSILRIQRNIREGKVGREEGINEIKSTFLHWMKAEESLARVAEMEDADELLSDDEGGNGDKHSTLKKIREELEKEDYQSSITTTGEFAKYTGPRLIDLLKDAGRVSQLDIQRAFDRVLEDPAASAKLLTLLGVVDEKTVNTALRSHALRAKQMVTDEEAVTAIRAAKDKSTERREIEREQAARHELDRRWRKSTA
ncbi:MAG: hypothetical protein K2X93_02285, partial [Candidatus Obscuribacterales bacterium]|nr:hypothetical protein [Candidatus Obscuribacterales bacterium]